MKYEVKYTVYFTPASPSSGPDYYMRDDLDDVGNEENPYEGDMWLSEDIWIRPTDDGEYFHDNAEYRANDPDKRNYVYVRVRSRGCDPMTNGTLEVYWSKASTGLAWPVNWQYSTDPSGNVISNLVGVQDLSTLNLQAGGEALLKFEWIPPNPQIFNDPGKHHYCLLARIVSPEDVMHCPEVPNPNPNCKCNNNIIWKNISVINVEGFNKDTVTMFVRDIFPNGTGPSCLELLDADLVHYEPSLNNATIRINLREPLLSLWQAGGMQGTGFVIDENGHFQVTTFPMNLCNLSLNSMQNYLIDIFIEGNEPEPFAFDLRHYKSSGAVSTIGGERVIYPGVGSNALPRLVTKKEKPNEPVRLYPNPVQNILYLDLETYLDSRSLTLMELYSKDGILLYNSQLSDKSTSIDLSHLQYAGLMIAKIKMNDRIFTKKLIRL